QKSLTATNGFNAKSCPISALTSQLSAPNSFYAATVTPPLSRSAMQNPGAGRRCSSKSIRVWKKKELSQKKPRGSLNWQVNGAQLHLNIGLPGARNANSPTALLLTLNGRGRD